MTVGQPPPERSRYPGPVSLLAVVVFHFGQVPSHSLRHPPHGQFPLTASSIFADSLIDGCARRLPPAVASIERIECDGKLLCASPGEIQVLKRS